MLNQWQHRPISKYDFAHVFEPFPQESYQYVLYGMGYHPDLAMSQSRYANLDTAENLFGQVSQMRSNFEKHLTTNRALLNKVKKYGFQKL